MNDLAILIPAYNDSDALRVTLNSIEENTNDFLVVVIDDGSSVPIVIEHNNYLFKIKLIRLENNKGITGALNAGLGLLLNDPSISYIARLDCGDKNLKNRFSVQLKELKEDLELMLIGSNVEFFDVNIIGNNFKTNLPLNDSCIKKNMWLKNCFIHPAVMFNKKVFSSVGNYDPTQKHIEDYVLFCSIIKKFKVKNLKEVLLLCEIRESGISCARETEQALSGLKFKFKEFDIKSLYWYFSILKSIIRLLIRRDIMNKVKRFLGMVK